MSHIAAALAKSKGKTVEPGALEDKPDAPASEASQPPMPSAVTPETSTRPTALQLAGGGLAVAVLGFAGWYLFLRTPSKSTATPPQVAVRVVPVPGPVVPMHEPALAKTSPLGIEAHPVVARTVPVPATAAAGPSDEIYNSVRKFSLSAVKSGKNGRAMINGKTYNAGDEVVPGLVLTEIRDGLLIFTDAAGNTYSRRF